MNDVNFIWLAKWFDKQCNGDWEHGNGIRIGTLDNPGWYITISLLDTELEDKAFQTIAVERSEVDWYHCFVKNNKFEGPCGIFNLPEVVEIFRSWAEENQADYKG